MRVKIKFLLLLCAFLLRGVSADAQNNLLAAFDLYPKVTSLGDLFFTPADRHAKEVRQDSEFEPSNLVAKPAFAENPLQLDGKPLDYRTFEYYTKGTLTVIKGQPNTKEAVAIPFYVSIRRNGKIIDSKKMPFANKVLFKINMLDIFPFTQGNDMLIIRPANPEDWQAKRILKLIGGC